MSRLRPWTSEDFPRLPAVGVDIPHRSSPDDFAPLAPPRPPFLTYPDRSSWSSIPFSSTSEHSESYREHSPTTSMSAPHPPSLSRPTSQRKLRRSTSSSEYAPVFSAHENQDESILLRPPPSSFKHPFQSHPGNPDPLPPRDLRRASMESLPRDRPSSTQGFRDDQALPSPDAPFVGGPPGTPPPPNPNAPHVYGNSVAGNFGRDSQTHLPRTNSAPSFRSPFLSPASRPSSTIWSPPTQPLYGASGTPNASTPQLSTVKKFRPPMASTMLSEKLTVQDKSWLEKQKGDRSRLSWWLTALMWFIGLCAGAAKVYFDYKSIHVLNDGQLCPVFVENFDSLNFNDWTPDIQLGGFGYVYFPLPPSLSLNYDQQQRI